MAMNENLMDDASYLDTIERETRRFRECLAGAAPGARVPSCPDWTVDDLIWHLGGEGQGFWAWVISHRPDVPDDYDEPQRPQGRHALLEVLDRSHEHLMNQLRNADPRDGAWSWAGDRSLHTVGFTVRRQAHEALIHRVDAELTVGDRTPIDRRLATDGALECLEWMYGNLPTWARFEPDGSRAVIEMTDTGHRVLVGLGRIVGDRPSTGEHVDQQELQVLERSVLVHPDVDATISGTSEDLDLWLWGRGPATPLEMSGDEAVLTRLTAVLGEPIA